MNGYGFFRSLRPLIGLGMVALGGWFIFASFIYSQLSTEARFRSTYGLSWRMEYEKALGPLAKAHAKVAASVVGVVAITSIVAWLFKLLRNPGRPRRTRKKERGYGSSSGLERNFRYRRNATVGIYFGLAGIVLAMIFVLFRLGISQDHADEVVLGMFVFLGGYSGIIAGCSYWLKAKQCQEAIVFIGLMPLALPFIPFVRLILFRVPAILPVGMLMMPLILIVVVAVLPDRSGVSKRNRWSWSRWAEQQRLTDSSSGAEGIEPHPQVEANQRLPLCSQKNQISTAADSSRSPLTSSE